MGQRNPNHQLKTVVNIPLLMGFQPSKVVQDSFHPQYDSIHSNTKPGSIFGAISSKRNPWSRPPGRCSGRTGQRSFHQSTNRHWQLEQCRGKWPEAELFIRLCSNPFIHDNHKRWSMNRFESPVQKIPTWPICSFSWFPPSVSQQGINQTVNKGFWGRICC